MSSAYKNAAKAHRRTHKERSQPAARARFGLLEKHKDYVLRARDFHSKERRLKALKQKAAFRNPDEFYFKMVKSKTDQGVHVLGKDESLTADMLKVFKTQDIGYLNYKLSTERKKIEKLQSNLHLIGQTPAAGDADADSDGEGAGGAAPAQRPTHTVFVDTEEEAKTFDPATYLDTLPELVDRKFNRPRIETLRTQKAVEPKSDRQLKKVERQRVAKYRELGERIDREEKMSKVRGHMELQKQLMGKGKRSKVRDGDKTSAPVYKWAPDRKK